MDSFNIFHLSSFLNKIKDDMGKRETKELKKWDAKLFLFHFGEIGKLYKIWKQETAQASL